MIPTQLIFIVINTLSKKILEDIYVLILKVTICITLRLISIILQGYTHPASIIATVFELIPSICTLNT